MNHSREWIREVFVDKAKLFLKVLNSQWKRGEEETSYITNLLRKLGVSSGSRILDLGCGNGRIAINLAKYGYRVVGIDISPAFIEDARKKAKDHNVEDKVTFIVGDARELSSLTSEYGPFDVILCVWTTLIGYYNNIDDDIKIFHEAHKVTRKGGYFLLLRTMNRDFIALAHSLYPRCSFVSELENGTVVIEPSI